MWKIQTPPPLVKVVYIWNVDYFDFGFDPPPPYGLFPLFVTFFVWKAPLNILCSNLCQQLILEYVRKKTMTWMGFLSMFGGYLGLCLGFSFISLIELIYWMLIKMTRDAWYFWSSKCNRYNILFILKILKPFLVDSTIPELRN